MCTWLHWQLAGRCHREIRASSAKGCEGKTVPVWATATQRCREGGVWGNHRAKGAFMCEWDVLGLQAAGDKNLLPTCRCAELPPPPPQFRHHSTHTGFVPAQLCSWGSVLYQQNSSSRELHEHPHSPQAMLNKGPFAMPTCFFCLRLVFHNTGFPMAFL